MLNIDQELTRLSQTFPVYQFILCWELCHYIIIQYCSVHNSQKQFKLFRLFLYLSKATGKKQLPSSQIVVQPAASADIYGVVLCISYSKCDWSNAYSLNLQNNGYWQLLTKVV